MTNFYDLIQWCFRDETAGITTIMVLIVVTEFITKLVKIITKKQ